MWKLKAVSRIGSSYLTVKQTLQEIKCHQIYHFTSFHSQIIDETFLKYLPGSTAWASHFLHLESPCYFVRWCLNFLPRLTCTDVGHPSNVWPCANCSLILRAWLSDEWGALVKRSECQKAQRTKSIGSKGHLILEAGLWRALGLW